jgi:hypothetical protein
MNRQLLQDWKNWLTRAGKWLAFGPPIETPIRYRRERLALVLEEGRRLSEEEGRMRA